MQISTWQHSIAKLLKRALFNPLHPNVLWSINQYSILKKPESERSMEEKGLLAAYDRPVDFTDRAALAPLIAWCRDEA